MKEEEAKKKCCPIISSSDPMSCDEAWIPCKGSDCMLWDEKRGRCALGNYSLLKKDK